MKAKELMEKELINTRVWINDYEEMVERKKQEILQAEEKIAEMKETEEDLMEHLELINTTNKIERKTKGFACGGI